MKPCSMPSKDNLSPAETYTTYKKRVFLKKKGSINVFLNEILNNSLKVEDKKLLLEKMTKQIKSALTKMGYK